MSFAGKAIGGKVARLVGYSSHVPLMKLDKIRFKYHI